MDRRRATATKSSLGSEVQVSRIADLDDAPTAQHADAMAHAERLDLVGSRIEDRGVAQLAMQPLEFSARVVTQFGVEIGQGLIEQEELRAGG